MQIPLSCWLFLPALIYWALILWMYFTGDTRQMILNGVMWITICVFLPTLAFTLFSLLGKGLGLIWHPLYPVFSWAGAGIAAVWFVIAVYGSVFGWRRLEVKNTDINIPDLPENFEGYRIAQLTDFHIGVYGATPGAVDRIVERVNSLKPDLIVFTGDLVNTSPEELPQFTEVLSRLKAPDGVISVLGNHDYCIYHRYKGDDTPARALARVVKSEESMGWNLLRNEAVQIKRGNDSIAIVGVENAGSGHFPDKSDLKKAMKGVPEDECTILLSHDPSHWHRDDYRHPTDACRTYARHAVPHRKFLSCRVVLSRMERTIQGGRSAAICKHRCGRQHCIPLRSISYYRHPYPQALILR